MTDPDIDTYWWFYLLLGFALGIVFYVSMTLFAFGQTELKDYLRTFMETDCCFTQDCCFIIQEKDVQDLGGMFYKILATGQQIKARDYSPDGQYWRCACDAFSGGWKVWDGANTRCLYVPRTSY